MVKEVRVKELKEETIEVTVTDDIRVMINDILETNPKLVEKVVAGDPAKRVMLKELMQQSYFRGFLTGAHHKAEDLRMGSEEDPH